MPDTHERAGAQYFSMNKLSVESAVQDALQMLEEGKPKKNILAHLVTAAEQLGDGNTVSSILLLDKNGLLRNGASPQLPDDYLAAIDGIKPDPRVGTCAAAAATGLMVVTKDFCDDSKWSELRHLPLALGFQGAWSMPIKTEKGIVLGTFGTYLREKREPQASEIAVVNTFAEVVVKVLMQVA